MFERFTDRARRVLVLAQEEARLLNHSFIGTEHILLGLIDEGEGLAAKALESLNISLVSVREEVEKTIGPAGSDPTGSPPFTPRAKKVLELSLREAHQLGHNYIGTEHMLLGLVREGEGVGARVLMSLGADLVTVRQRVISQLSGYQGRDPQSTPEHPGLLQVPIGESWSLEVVRAGKGPEVFAEAYDRLRELVTQLGSTLDDGRIRVMSVDTKSGPGLRLALSHSPGPSVEVDEPAEAEDPEGAADPEGAGGGADQ